MRLGVITPISLQSARSPFGPAPLAANWGNRFHKFQELGDLVPISSGQLYSQRNSVSIGQQVMLASFFTPIRGIWACFFASARCLDQGCINDSSAPIDLPARLKLREK